MDFKLQQEGEFSYIEEGEGKVLLLLHGLFGALSNFEHLINHFSKTHKVVIPMLPLYEYERENTTVPAMKDFIYRFINHKKYDKVSLIGNSLGGHVALLFCLDYLDKVENLVLTGSSGLFESAMGDTFPKRGSYEYIEKKTQDTFYDPKTATKALVDEVFDIVNDRNKVIRVLALARSAIRQNVGEHLHKIIIPSLLIWGKEDQVTPAFVGEEFEKLLPQAKLHFIDKCGHAPMMEHPATFNQILEQFLQ